jgi:mono/diheme cytochrome c family protein
MARAGSTLGQRRILAGALLCLISACSPPASEPANGTGSRPPAVGSQKADDPSVYRGAAIAGQVCAQCHDTSGGSETKPGFSAASFASVANRAGMDTAKLRYWLTSLHPSMPNYLFDNTTVDDLAAYIMSLRRPS